MYSSARVELQFERNRVLPERKRWRNEINNNVFEAEDKWVGPGKIQDSWSRKSIEIDKNPTLKGRAWKLWMWADEYFPRRNY